MSETIQNRKKFSLKAFTRRHGANIVLVLPAVLFFCYAVLVPFIQSFPVSFTNKKALFSTNWEYIGFQNYQKLLQNHTFLSTFGHTAQFTLVTVIGSNIMGFALALLIHRSGMFNNLCRTLFFIPFTVSSVSATKVWSYVYSDIFLPLTGLASPLGISSQVIYGIAVIAIWREMGYCMLIYIAALQTIPEEYYEAAKVEGASPIHSFLHITIPMSVPAITANTTLVLAWGLRCFDYSQMVANMKTAKTTAVFVYEYIFGNARAGLGQASAIILTVVLIIITNLVNGFLRKKEVVL